MCTAESLLGIVIAVQSKLLRFTAGLRENLPEGSSLDDRKLPSAVRDASVLVIGDHNTIATAAKNATTAVLSALRAACRCLMGGLPRTGPRQSGRQPREGSTDAQTSQRRPKRRAALRSTHAALTAPLAGSLRPVPLPPMATPHRARRRHLRAPRDLAQQTAAPHLPRHAHTHRDRDSTSTPKRSTNPLIRRQTQGPPEPAQ